jgi:hypothetical protein
MSEQTMHPAPAEAKAVATRPFAAISMTPPGSTLLSYVMTTSPDPLQVSPSLTQPATGTLTLIVSCPKDVGGANVAQIVITLSVQDPNNPDPSDLAMVAPAVHAAAIASTGSDEWGVTSGLAAGAFVFTPKQGPVAVGSQSLAITFAGFEISPLVGTAQIRVAEWVSTDAPPSPHQPPSATGSIEVTKFPPGFFVANFAASAAAVDSGGTVLLTWNASTNASCEIEYEHQRFPVSAQSWSSPKLYSTAVFVLHGSATQNRQTVSISKTTSVEVLSPLVVSFRADPEQVAPSQPITLTWVAAGADGVYLITGTTGRETLPLVPDAKKPKTITPKWGASYALQAYRKRAGEDEALSAPYPLVFGFLPIDISVFKADPPEVSDIKPNTLVLWDVANATAVKFQGAVVDGRGSHPDVPKDDMTYTLDATWIDGSVTSRTVTVKSHKILDVWATGSAEYVNDHGKRAGRLTVTVKILVVAESVKLSPLSVDFPVGSYQATAQAVALGPRTWEARIVFDLPFTPTWKWVPGTYGRNTAVNSVRANIEVNGQLVPGLYLRQV